MGPIAALTDPPTKTDYGTASPEESKPKPTTATATVEDTSNPTMAGNSLEDDSSRVQETAAFDLMATHVDNIGKAIEATDDTRRARLLDDAMETTEDTAESGLFDDAIPADSHEPAGAGLSTETTGANVGSKAEDEGLSPEDE